MGSLSDRIVDFIWANWEWLDFPVGCVGAGGLYWRIPFLASASPSVGGDCLGPRYPAVTVYRYPLSGVRQPQGGGPARPAWAAPDDDCGRFRLSDATSFAATGGRHGIAGSGVLRTVAYPRRWSSGAKGVAPHRGAATSHIDVSTALIGRDVLGDEILKLYAAGTRWRAGTPPD